MKTQVTAAVLAAMVGVAALSLPGTAAARTRNVGYYEMCTGTGGTGHAAAITAAGATPVNVNVPDAATLGTLDALFVTNCSNSGYGAEYTSNLPAISNAVANGLTLIVHDRRVTGAQSVLPGSAGISFVGSVYSANVDFPATSPILVGPGGTLNDASLDGGNSSTHGYVASAGLPAGRIALAHEASATRLATIAYPYGTGEVVYSTIPLDYYLAGNNPANFRTLYAPNLIAWAAALRFVSCADEGLVGGQLSLCRQVCELPQTPTKMTSLIKLYMTTYRSQPPCAN